MPITAWIDEIVKEFPLTLTEDLTPAIRSAMCHLHNVERRAF